MHVVCQGFYALVQEFWVAGAQVYQVYGMEEGRPDSGGFRLLPEGGGLLLDVEMLQGCVPGPVVFRGAEDAGCGHSLYQGDRC